MPVFSEDDFIQYCVVEAMRVRASREEQKAHKDAERKQWKKGPLGGER